MATSYRANNRKGEYVPLRQVVDPSGDDSRADQDANAREAAYKKSILLPSYAMISIACVLCSVLSALGPAVANFAEHAVHVDPSIGDMEDAYDDIFLALSLNRIIAVPASFVGGLVLKKFHNQGSFIVGFWQILGGMITAGMAIHGYQNYLMIVSILLVAIGAIIGFVLVILTTLLMAIYSGTDANWWINLMALAGGLGFAIGPLTFLICQYAGEGIWCFYIFGACQWIIAFILLTQPPLQVSAEELNSAKQKKVSGGRPKAGASSGHKVSLDAKPKWSTVLVLHLFAGFGCGAEFNFPVLLTTYIELTGIASAEWGDWLTYGYWTTYLIGRLVKTKYTPHPLRNFALVLPISTICFTLWLFFPYNIWVMSAISLILGWSMNPSFPETLNVARGVTPLSIPAMTLLTLSRFLYAAALNLFLIWASLEWGIPTAVRYSVVICFYLSLPFAVIFCFMESKYVKAAFGCAEKTPGPYDVLDEDGSGDSPSDFTDFTDPYDD